MIETLKVISRALNLLLDYFKSYRKKASYEERQEEREKVEENPSAWFSEHFSSDGVQLDERTDDARKADETSDKSSS